MAVTVKADVRDFSDTRVHGFNGAHQVLGKGRECVLDMCRQPVVPQDSIHGLPAKPFRRQGRTVRERMAGSNRMQTAHEPAQPHAGIALVQFRCVAPATLENREPEAIVCMQC